jgi:pimeloyl-ACP methyl ester carboxylesterase
MEGILRIAIIGALIPLALIVFFAYLKVKGSLQMRKTTAPDGPIGVVVRDFDEGYPYLEEAAKWLGEVHKETHRITSFDGWKLTAVFITHPNPRGGALVFPGWTDRKEYYYAEIKMLYDNGFSVLCPDQRAMGESEGKYCTFGARERKDAMQWLGVLESLAPKPSIVFGRSMGAAVAMLLSCDAGQRIAACIEDCGFSSMEEEMRHFTRETNKNIPPALEDFFFVLARPMIRLFGGSLAKTNCVKELADCKVPMLFIHGKEDSFVPYPMMDKLYQAHGGKKRALSIAGAGHGRAIAEGTQEYLDTVNEFLNDILGGNTQ